MKNENTPDLFAAPGIAVSGKAIIPLRDLALAAHIINLAVEKGAYNAAEAYDVGRVYSAIVNFVSDATKVDAVEEPKKPVPAAEREKKTRTVKKDAK